MTLTTRIVIGIVTVVLIGAGAAAVLGSLYAVSKDTHPPCGELPTTAKAAAALTDNQALVDELEGLGKGISVGVGNPCRDGQDRALIEVTYGSKSEREAIGGLLGRRDGFGVPVHLVQR